MEDVEAIRFKLGMFGIQISEQRPTAHIYCDNKGVMKNSTKMESTLDKKHLEVAHHVTRQNMAAEVCSIAWIGSAFNLSDVFAMKLAAATRDFLFGEWTY